ncbi:MAG: heavy-metal-associated domain-containing protein, partial [Lachnospiraceae bacterium]|nr:heavy-metal-associated domain-containing protein [Lachnospiraceae bacterium]
MEKITLQIDGMKCGMCEKHVNEAIQNAFKVKSVVSSHDTNTTVIETET